MFVLSKGGAACSSKRFRKRPAKSDVAWGVGPQFQCVGQAWDRSSNAWDRTPRLAYILLKGNGVGWGAAARARFSVHWLVNIVVKATAASGVARLTCAGCRLRGPSGAAGAEGSDHATTPLSAP